VRGGADFSAITRALSKTQIKINVFSKKANKSLNKGFSSASKSLSKAQSSISTFKSSTTKAFKAVSAAVSALAIGKLIKDSTQMAMSVESAMGNIERNMGSASKAFDNWVKTQSKAFGMARADAYKYGSTFSNLLSSFVGGAEETATSTQELMKAAAVISSKTGRSFEDVSERIRSGLLGSTEAIEDLGVYVNVSMLESTKAFKKFANGKSWNQLTYQTQQQIRLAAILEQTYERYGDTLANTTATKQQRFLATLENIKLNIGQAFLPIYNIVLPALDRLASKIEQVTAQFAAGMQLIFGKPAETKSIQKQAQAVSALGDAAEETGKKSKKALAGIDEINVLSNAGDATGDAAAATGTIGAAAITAPQIEQPDVAWVETVKSKLSDLSEYFSTKFAPSISSWSKAFENLKQPAQNAFGSVITSAKNLWTNTLAPFGSYLTTNWIPNITNSFSQTFAPIFSDVAAVAISEFAKEFEFVCKQISLYTTDILTPAFDFAKKVALDVFEGIKNTWDEHGAGILKAFQNFSDSLRNIWFSLYDNAIKPVFTYIGNTVSWLWDKHLKPLWDNISDFVGALIEFVLVLWNNCLAPFVTRVVERLGPPIAFVIGMIGDVFGTVFAFIVDVIGGLIKTLTGILDFITGVFSGNWEKAWKGIGKIFGGIWDAIYGVIKGILNLIIDGLNMLWGGIYNVAKGVVDSIGGIAGAIGKIFGKDWKFSLPATVPKIPKLAQGGIAYGPSLVQVAEYTGARSNPEVIAPLDRLRGMIANIAGGDITLTANILLDDGTIVGRTTQRITRQSRLTGAPALGV